MAGIERRPKDFRVVWRQNGVKQFEQFPTEKAAERFRLLVEAHGNRWPRGWIKHHGFVEHHSDAPTFSEWAGRAIASRSRANARTRHDYTRDVELHIEPTFGDVPLDLISREMVGNWLIAMSRAAGSDKTVKNVHGLASSIMEDAIRAELITRNPFKGAFGTLPQVRTEEMVFLTRPEFDVLLAGTVEAYRPLVATLGMTGLRWSEATALQCADVNVHTRRLSVVRAWKRTPENYFVLGEPKSNRSRRTITLPASLAATLHPLVTGADPGGFVFRSKMDRPIRHANFRQRVWLPAVKALQEANVPKSPRIHDLRHSHASWLIAAGVPLPAIQRRLGHESITTTVDRYGHLAPEMDDVITQALDGTDHDGEVLE